MTSVGRNIKITQQGNVKIEIIIIILKIFIMMIMIVKHLEEYMVLNMKTGNGKVGRIEY